VSEATATHLPEATSADLPEWTLRGGSQEGGRPAELLVRDVVDVRAPPEEVLHDRDEAPVARLLRRGQLMVRPLLKPRVMTTEGTPLVQHHAPPGYHTCNGVQLMEFWQVTSAPAFTNFSTRDSTPYALAIWTGVLHDSLVVIHLAAQMPPHARAHQPELNAPGPRFVLVLKSCPDPPLASTQSMIAAPALAVDDEWQHACSGVQPSHRGEGSY
jgi:hypothetical protein